MTDDDKALMEAMKDAMLHGRGFIKDGKHIPIEDVYIDPRDATIEAQAAEIERLIKASDGDVGLMHWQGEKIERLEAEIDRLRSLLAEAVEYPASDYLDNGVLNRIYAALEGKEEQ
jgi:hypothetical protein